MFALFGKKIYLFFIRLAILIFLGSCNLLENSEPPRNNPNDPISTTGTLDPGIFYGNWCGPKHSGPAAPLDSLDACCQTHDQCYETYVKTLINYLECTADNAKIQCDRALVTCLKALPADTNLWTLKPMDSAKAVDYRDEAYAVFKTCTNLADLFN